MFCFINFYLISLELLIKRTLKQLDKAVLESFLCESIVSVIVMVYEPILLSFITKGKKQEYDGEDTCTYECYKSTVPTIEVNHETHEGACTGGTDEVTKQACKACSAARCFAWHHVGCLEADHHNRTVDKEADRDERQVIDEDITGRIEPVYENGNDNKNHKADRSRSATAAEYTVA